MNRKTSRRRPCAFSRRTSVSSQQRSLPFYSESRLVCSFLVGARGPSFPPPPPPRSVSGNLVTALNLKFWHAYGASIHLLARHTARGFSRNPLIVPNTNNIYIHYNETEFTAGFWGWLQDSLILDFCVLSCRPPRILSGCVAARGTLTGLPTQERRVCPSANRWPFLWSPSPPPIAACPLEYLVCVCAWLASGDRKELLDSGSLSDELFCLRRA